MDPTSAFVSQFVTQLELARKGLRDMHSWYIFSDKRCGTIQERFEQDAAEFVAYQKMFKV